MSSEDSDRDASFPAARIVISTVGLLLTLLVIAALVRPDMVMHVMHMVMRDTRATVGM